MIVSSSSACSVTSAASCAPAASSAVTSACRTRGRGPAVSASSTTARALASGSSSGSCARYRIVSPRRTLTRPAVGLLDAGEDLRERRLAGAVGADEADLLAARQRERRVVEDDLRPERLAEVLGGEGGQSAGMDSKTTQSWPAGATSDGDRLRHGAGVEAAFRRR